MPGHESFHWSMYHHLLGIRVFRLYCTPVYNGLSSVSIQSFFPFPTTIRPPARLRLRSPRPATFSFVSGCVLSTLDLAFHLVISLNLYFRLLIILTSPLHPLRPRTMYTTRSAPPHHTSTTFLPPHPLLPLPLLARSADARTFGLPTLRSVEVYHG